MSKSDDGYYRPGMDSVEIVASENEIKGMTLLDWFAGKVLTGIYSVEGPHLIPHDKYLENNARICFAQAEAMIKERERRLKNG